MAASLGVRILPGEESKGSEQSYKVLGGDPTMEGQRYATSPPWPVAKRVVCWTTAEEKFRPFQKVFA
jgi:hypothetical protein